MLLASPVLTELLLRDLLEALDNQLVYVWDCRLYCHLQRVLFGCVCCIEAGRLYKLERVQVLVHCPKEQLMLLVFFLMLYFLVLLFEFCWIGMV